MPSPVVRPGAFTDIDAFVFETCGYLLIEDVLSQAEVEECLDASKRIHAAAGSSDWAQVGRGYETESALERLIDHPAVIPKVRALYRDRFILQASWNTVQPARGGMGGWHQDGSGAYDFKELGYPIPLLQLRVSYLLTDQSRPRTGNMELIPGSHRSALPLPESVQSGAADVPISEVICARAGSALIFHNAVWHRTYAHDGDYDRYTAHYVYSPPWVRSSDRLQNSPELIARTTPLRRDLLAEFARPDAPYGIGYSAPDFSTTESQS